MGVHKNLEWNYNCHEMGVHINSGWILDCFKWGTHYFRVELELL